VIVAIFPDDIVRQLDSALDDLASWIVQIDVDLTRRFEHAKAARGRVEERDESLRENVLARVLLHVVQPARPVDTPVHHMHSRDGAAPWTTCSTPLSPSSIHSTTRAPLSVPVSLGLAAASRIKRSAIEHDRGPTTDAISDVNHASFKLDQMGIGIIKTFSYRHGIVYPQITQICSV
jgi:hypothetical protein